MPPLHEMYDQQGPSSHSYSNSNSYNNSHSYNNSNSNSYSNSHNGSSDGNMDGLRKSPQHFYNLSMIVPQSVYESFPPTWRRSSSLARDALPQSHKQTSPAIKGAVRFSRRVQVCESSASACDGLSSSQHGFPRGFPQHSQQQQQQEEHPYDVATRWYSRAEMNEMTQEREQTKAESRNGMILLDDEKHCTRGLEDMWDSRGKAHQILSVQETLVEQQLLREEGVGAHDARLLAIVYSEYAHSAVKEARARAMQDELAAKRIHRTNSSSSTSRSSSLSPARRRAPSRSSSPTPPTNAFPSTINVRSNARSNARSSRLEQSMITPSLSTGLVATGVSFPAFYEDDEDDEKLYASFASFDFDVDANKSNHIQKTRTTVRAAAPATANLGQRHEYGANTSASRMGMPAQLQQAQRQTSYRPLQTTSQMANTGYDEVNERLQELKERTTRSSRNPQNTAAATNSNSNNNAHTRADSISRSASLRLAEGLTNSSHHSMHSMIDSSSHHRSGNGADKKKSRTTAPGFRRRGWRASREPQPDPAATLDPAGDMHRMVAPSMTPPPPSQSPRPQQRVVRRPRPVAPKYLRSG